MKQAPQHVLRWIAFLVAALILLLDSAATAAGAAAGEVSDAAPWAQTARFAGFRFELTVKHGGIARAHEVASPQLAEDSTQTTATVGSSSAAKVLIHESVSIIQYDGEHHHGGAPAAIRPTSLAFNRTEVIAAIVSFADERDMFGWVQQPADTETVVGEARGSKSDAAALQAFLRSEACAAAAGVEPDVLHVVMHEYKNTRIQYHFADFKVVAPTRQMCFDQPPHRCRAVANVKEARRTFGRARPASDRTERAGRAG